MNRVKKTRVVIILPTYNEADNIGKLIPILQDVFKTIPQYECLVLVVDDTSPDGTGDQVRSLMKHYDNIDLLIGKKEGLGTAYVRGMEYAYSHMKADIMFEMDADLSHDPMLIPAFLERIEEGCDVVVGSRYTKGGSIPVNWPWYRKLFSICGNLFVRFGLMIPRVTEWTGGYRALKSEVFLKIKKGLERYKGYTFQIASLHRVVMAGYKIGEVPIHFVDRKWGQSKIVPVEYIPTLMRYVFTHSSFVKYVITGLFGFAVDFGVSYIVVENTHMFIPLASVISGEAAISTNFFINNYWSFAHKRIKGGRGSMLTKYLHFNFIAAGSVVIQYVGLWLALHLFGNPEVSLLFITLDAWIVYKALIIGFFIIPYSYIMYNRFIWPKKKN